MNNFINELSTYLATLSSTAFIINSQMNTTGYTVFKRYEDGIHYASSTPNFVLTPFGITPYVNDTGLL